MKPLIVRSPLALHAITASALPLNWTVGTPRDGFVASPPQQVKRNVDGISVKGIITYQLSELLAELLSMQGQVTYLDPIVAIYPRLTVVSWVASSGVSPDSSHLFLCRR